MGHNHREGTGRRGIDLALGRVGPHRGHVGRHIVRKMIGPGVDPAHRKRKLRKGENDRAADMAGAKEQDRFAGLAEPLHEPLFGRGFAIFRGVNIPIQNLSRDPALRSHAADADKRPGFLRGGKFANMVEIAGIEGLNQGSHRSAAALAEIRAQRPDLHRCRGRLRR
ncbi:hypothetical protein GALL_528740 [mine drainage metagenome]|uniref:Uncharacterized protein n=1 Tax=mine drainage metagenome TaxID=410659 RepID=A0A1J5PCM2_9ZZZZ